MIPYPLTAAIDAACVMELRAVSDFIPSGDHEVVICEVVQYRNGLPAAFPSDSAMQQAPTSPAASGTMGLDRTSASVDFADVDEVAADALYTSDLRRLGLML